MYIDTNGRYSNAQAQYGQRAVKSARWPGLRAYDIILATYANN